MRTQPSKAAGIWVLALALLCDGNLFAGSAEANFSQANKLYAEGKFAAAAESYQKIIQAGAVSPALLFNAGSAEFKAGHLGRAIAAYRRAEALTPRDPELRANLAFVRNQVQGVTRRETRWQDWVGSLSLNEGTLLTAGLFWTALGLLIAAQLRPALGPRLRSPVRLTVALTLLSATVLALQAANHFNSAVAVVTAAEAVARSGPFEEAQHVFPLHDGAELRVLDRHEDWVEVTNGAGKYGWLPLKQVAVLPGA